MIAALHVLRAYVCPLFPLRGRYTIRILWLLLIYCWGRALVQIYGG